MKKFTAGMSKDSERVDQPEGTYRDALNANLYYIKGAVVNEQGTIPIQNRGFVYADNIIGQCALKDGRIVVFFNYTFQNATTSAISIVDTAQGLNTLIYRNAELNFQPSNTIEATSKTNANGDILVYFTDNYIQRATEAVTGIEYITDYNPPRVINITRQLESPIAQLYSNPDYTIEKLDLFLNSGLIPEFRNISIEEGGGVVTGTYHLALAYVDEDLNRTNYLVTSNPVHVVTEHEDAIPTETITGDPQGSQSNKTIIWTVDIPTPSNYTHVRPVIIQRFGGGINQESSEFAYELQIVKIPDTGSQDYVTLQVAYTGLENVASGTITDVIVDSVRYETAKTFVQLDNRLYISNLQARGDIGYQRFANNITVTPRVTAVPRFDPMLVKTPYLNYGYYEFTGPASNNLVDDFASFRNLQINYGADGFFSSRVRKGYKDVRMSHQYRGYRRSEVYAFYISFVLNDGTETYAYHIPGRRANPITSIGSDIAENSRLTGGNVTTIQQAINLDLTEFSELYPDSRLHQVVDTQFIDNSISQAMSYWENEDERYPDSDDFDRVSVDINTGQLYNNGTLRDQRVRHHKMPPNRNTVYSFIETLNDLDDQIRPFNLFNSGTASTNGLRLKETINILGVEFQNIHIPAFIRQQVQGYKIYYAKRSQENKTIIGQSAIIPSWFEDATIAGTRPESAYKDEVKPAWMLKGHIPWHRREFPYLNNVPGSSSSAAAMPVFTFHDFNLLKNKHTLTGATHIDIQKVMTMRMWAGGNKKSMGEYSDNNSSVSDANWLNSTIGNESYYEWVDGDDDGVFDDDLAPSGLAEGAVTRPDGVLNYWTSVMVAQRYWDPQYPTNSPDQWSHMTFSSGYWITRYNTLFTIAPNSITYLTGSTILENTDTNAFKGAGYLMHYSGESCIAVGLSSGLPVLMDHREYSSSSPFASWFVGADWFQPWVDGSARRYNKLTEINAQSNNYNYTAWPALYLTNLCSYKRNVYQPFDEQKLVWTGYYKSLDKDPNSAFESYGIFQSEIVHGGDTYISRHSFRTTSQDYGTLFPSISYGQLLNDQVNYPNAPGRWATNPFLNNSNYQNEDGEGNGLLTKYRPIDPYATIYNFYCESDDLLGFRHQGDNSEGVTLDESMFFNASTATDVLFNGPHKDYTKSENLLYMNNYSAVQDIKTTVPLPKKLFSPTLYDTRTLRSNVDDGSIQDKYRFFLALDYKDIAKNRGEITKVFTLGSILYLHTERSLFVTRGRQQLGLGDNTQAFVGSGDIFEQNPDEMIPTTEGYGGTDCQFASLTTRFGQFFVSRKDRKVYMMGQNIEELSSLGMEKWFLDNIPYEIDQYIDLEEIANLDAPTEFFGFTAAYDPTYKRIILSKKERVPLPVFENILAQGIEQPTAVDGGFQYWDPRLEQYVIALFNDNTRFEDGGWTVSYYPELKVWGSRHSYIPVIFANNQQQYYSLTNGNNEQSNVWEHSNLNTPGNYYNAQYNFELEYIDNSEIGAPKVFGSIRYWTEVVDNNTVDTDVVNKHISPGFTSFYVYNSNQISGERDVFYLNNARLVDRFWYINDFRDLSNYALNVAGVVANNQLNPQDIFNTGSTTNPTNVSMFNDEGVINLNYIDNNKPWYNQKKFVDHYLGVRLISNNNTGNLIYLYAAGSKFRQSFR
jgi:hypothetical protein